METENTEWGNETRTEDGRTTQEKRSQRQIAAQRWPSGRNQRVYDWIKGHQETGGGD